MEHVRVSGSLWVLRFRQAALEAGITHSCLTTEGVAPNEISRRVERSWGDMSGTREAWVVRDEAL